VCYYCFFSDCRIYLFSSLAARVFNKLTRSTMEVLSCGIGTQQVFLTEFTDATDGNQWNIVERTAYI